MKKILFCAFVAISSLCFSQTKSILFIGNSYTYCNDGVDQMLKNMAFDSGDTIYTEAFTIGGATFSQFCSNPETFARISSRDWDYVVLQEQSQLPSFPPSQVENECYPYAKQLCDSIRANSECTQILFFMTWGRKNGDSYNCANYPPLCTYEGMQQRLFESYTEMGNDNNAIAVPVGMAWKYVRDNYPEINLYQSDESHPSLEGTYLAALCFYRAIFGEGTYYYIENWGVETRFYLNYAVENAFYTYSTDCNLGNIMMVSVGLQPGLCKMEIASAVEVNCSYADSCVCTFADMRRVEYEPVGDFTVDLTMYLDESYENQPITFYATLYKDGCSMSDCVEFVYVRNTSDVETNGINALSFVNPVVDGKIRFSEEVSGNYEIYSSDGRLLVGGVVSGNEIDVADLKSGMYLLKVGERSGKVVVK